MTEKTAKIIDLSQIDDNDNFTITRIRAVISELITQTRFSISAIYQLKEDFSSVSEMDIPDVLISLMSNLLVNIFVHLRTNFHNIELEIKAFDFVNQQIYNTSKELFLMYMTKNNGDTNMH